MRTPKQLLDAIALVAPSLSLGVIWSHDNDETFEGSGDWTIGKSADDWQCWQSEVIARAIVNGVLVSASEYLGGTWEKFGDDPAKSNPDISGYFPQMACEAIESLVREKTFEDSKLEQEAEAAISLLKTEMQER